MAKLVTGLGVTRSAVALCLQALGYQKSTIRAKKNNKESRAEMTPLGPSSPYIGNRTLILAKGLALTLTLRSRRNLLLTITRAMLFVPFSALLRFNGGPPPYVLLGSSLSCEDCRRYDRNGCNRCNHFHHVSHA
jgi:hypothetical protein